MHTHERNARQLACSLGRPWSDCGETERLWLKEHANPTDEPDAEALARQLAREQRDHALTRHLLGYCMTALNQIIDGAPRSEPDETDAANFDSFESIETFGYACARFNDACTAGLAKNQVRWLRLAARRAATAEQIAALALYLQFNGTHADPDDAADTIRDAADPVREAYLARVIRSDWQFL